MKDTIRRRRRLVVGVAAVCLMALTGCSDAPSDGWERLEGDRLTVEYPQEWTPGEGSGEQWVLAARGDGAGVQVADPFDNSRVASAAMATLRFQAQMGLEDFTPGALRDIDVDGADSAVMQSYSYVDDGEPAKGAWIIASQTQPPASVAVTIAGPKVDDALISHVVDTLTYTSSDETVEPTTP